MSKVTLRNLLLALLFFCGGLVTMGIVFLYVQEEGAQLRDYLRVVEEERVADSVRIQQQKAYDNSEAERAALQTFYLSDEGDSIDFLNEVETMARDVGIELETQSLNTVEEDAATWVTIDFLFAGRELAVKEFVSVLETLPYVLELQSLRLSVNEVSLWSAEVTVRVRVL